jgi:acetyl-CoA carboxylase biotin carboxylase subunit
MKRVLVANRGEIALRIIRACRAEGLATVAVYSDADQSLPQVWAADKSLKIGPPAASQSYLQPDLLLHVAKETGCDALHPGYGFLAERAEFARRCAEEGILFIGPPAEVIALMGDKSAARRTVTSLKVPVVPGSSEAFVDETQATAAADAIGFPLLLKARAGGGGRGIRLVEEKKDFTTRFAEARGEAQATFGDGHLYIERYFARVRHIEVQVFGDSHGNVAHAWERDCSVQRRHQKLIEEAPASILDDATRRAICAAAVKVAASANYQSAGTVEFLLDAESGDFYFLEMNTRIQVEHPVTEVVTGTDLVREQLRTAAGEKLSFARQPPEIRGHAVEFRINAEDPEQSFQPVPGTIRRWDPPRGPHLRLDSHVYQGYTVPPYYDSLLGKMIVRGDTRDMALANASAALASFRVEGIPTTIALHRRILGHDDFSNDRIHTRWVESLTSYRRPAP